MIVSRCCKHEVYVFSANEGTSFYLCGKCNRPCDTVFSLGLNNAGHDDTRSKAETQAVIG